MNGKHLGVLVIVMLAAGCNQQINGPAKQQIGVPANNSTAGSPPSAPLQMPPPGAIKSGGPATTSADSSVPVSGSAGNTSSAADDPLAGLGSNKYADGILPLGDYDYITTGPKKGYVYLCRAQTGGGGAQGNPSWISGNTWNINQKINVEGSVGWPNASYSMKINGNNRIIATNDLPTGHTTGVFPIQSSDPAYQIDRNPNTITPQNFTFILPAHPTQNASPNCMGGEVGVMTDGVALFNAFDAEGRDAAAHEAQDSCQAHPQEGGIYHYHSLSSCIKNATVSNVIGYAFDGFPITGPQLPNGKYLTTSDLDECHGLTSAITLDGKSVTMYHYVMTEDFPYSVSCFWGHDTLTGPLGGTGQSLTQAAASGQSANQQSSDSSSSGQNQPGGAPPQAAIDACTGQSSGAACSFSAPSGTVSGSCQTPPGQGSLACVPQ